MEAQQTAQNLLWQQSQVKVEQRRALLRQSPVTLWMTGLSGSGKSTLAFSLEKRLIESGHACFVLDGDNVRHGLNRDLGFSPEARAENIRRIAEVARLMNAAGLIVITSFISPYRNDREMAREIIGDETFREIYISTPLERCEERDPKGLYLKARSGLIKAFTGISAPYEPPIRASLCLDTSLHSIDHCTDQMQALINPFLSQTQDKSDRS